MAKMVKCPECRGKGVTSCNLVYATDKHPYDCPVCGGTNKAICHLCDGSGKVRDDD